MPGKYMKGALVQFTPTILIPIPNVIIFQYNPETITHTWTQSDTGGAAKSGSQSNPQAVPADPGEAFSFNLVMDANDDIGNNNPLAIVSGVYTRLAALEMLLFPADPNQSLLGGLLGVTSTDQSRSVPSKILPTVLFVWGPERIVPVRVTSLTITENRYDALLNPVHAEAQIGLRVLTPDELAAAKSTSDPLADLGSIAYDYSHGLRKAFALANLANAVESIVGMLPV
jgi:hypothetical protein